MVWERVQDLFEKYSEDFRRVFEKRKSKTDNRKINVKNITVLKKSCSSFGLAKFFENRINLDLG